MYVLFAFCIIFTTLLLNGIGSWNTSLWKQESTYLTLSVSWLLVLQDAMSQGISNNDIDSIHLELSEPFSKV